MPIDDRELILRLLDPALSTGDVSRAAGLNPYVFAMRGVALEDVVRKLKRQGRTDEQARIDLRTAMRESSEPFETVAERLLGVPKDGAAP